MTNYLYNGVELPELPEWDKTEYPHAIIYQVNASLGVNAYYMLVVSVNPAVVRQDRNLLTGATYPTLEIDGTYKDYLLSVTWQENSEVGDGHIKKLEAISNLWTTTDIYYADDYSIDETLAGTVYLAASDPVPTPPIPADLYIKENGKVYKVDMYRVRKGAPILQEKTATENGEVTADDGYEGLSKVIVNVPTGGSGGGGEHYEGNPYLTFSSANAFTIATANSSKNWNGTLYYSNDTETWSEWDGTTAIASAEHEGEQRIYMRGIGNVYVTMGSTGTGFVLSGNSIECNGNIETLLDFESVAAGNHPLMGHSCYVYLFENCTALTTPPELPATTLSAYCYQYMFRGCTSLTTAPELPATTLSAYCYSVMFSGCTSLTTAPELPATTLSAYCYNAMFSGCTSLTTAPELPATTLAECCYMRTFSGCTSLTTAPELPATTMADTCYDSMFEDCTSLTTAPELPATTLAYRCYDMMFYDCTALTTAPELPATTLADTCYRYMFYGCKELTTIPNLPATTLADTCYYGMFYNCSGIKVSKTSSTTYKNAYRIPKTGTGTTGANSLYLMFTGTGGSFTSTPTINTTYYTSNTVV